MRAFLQILVIFPLILVHCNCSKAQYNDSVYFFSLNETLLTNINQQKLLSPNKITIINFSKVKNKYLVAVAQDNCTEFARLFNIEFCLDSILGFFEIENCKGIVSGTNNPLITGEKKQSQPAWFVKGIKYRTHVFVDTVSLTIPLYFTKRPIIKYFLINRRGKILKCTNNREMKLSKNYYLFGSKNSDNKPIQ